MVGWDSGGSKILAREFAGGTQIPQQPGNDDDGEEHKQDETKAEEGFHAGGFRRVAGGKASRNREKTGPLAPQNPRRVVSSAWVSGLSNSAGNRPSTTNNTAGISTAMRWDMLSATGAASAASLTNACFNTFR